MEEVPIFQAPDKLTAFEVNKTQLSSVVMRTQAGANLLHHLSSLASGWWVDLNKAAMQNSRQYLQMTEAYSS